MIVQSYNIYPSLKYYPCSIPHTIVHSILVLTIILVHGSEDHSAYVEVKTHPDGIRSHQDSPGLLRRRLMGICVRRRLMGICAIMNFPPPLNSPPSPFPAATL